MARFDDFDLDVTKIIRTPSAMPASTVESRSLCSTQFLFPQTLSCGCQITGK